MGYAIVKEPVWVAELPDKPGKLASVLGPLCEAGANLEFIIERRAWNKPGCVIFVGPIHGAKQVRAARSVGFEKALGMHSLRFEGPDKPGLAYRVAKLLGDAGINIRGWTSASLGQECAIYFAFSSGDDTERAIRLLRSEFGKKK